MKRSHEEMIDFQAERHEQADPDVFYSEEEYVLSLIHKFAYQSASQLVGGGKVLDLGCGVGYGSAIISESRAEVVGADVSSKAISKARSLYGARGTRFELVNGKELPFKDGEFDLIVSFQVIEHIVDQRVYLGEVKRVLSPGGLVVFTTPNARLRLDPGMKPWNPFHFKEFDARQLKSLLSGFFQEVSIVGLSAREPLYSIETSRLKKIRAKVGRRRKIKKLLPRRVFDAANKIRRTLRATFKNRESPPPLDRNFAKTHGPELLFYSFDNLDSSLDLLAFCADGKSNKKLSEALGIVGELSNQR